MTNKKIFQAWSKKSKKVEKMLAVFDANPRLKVPGIMRKSSIGALHKEGEKVKRDLAKYEIAAVRRENKFAERVSPYFDDIDDAYEMTKAVLKTKYPALYAEHFGK